jgi:hypothetical protein
MSNTVNVAGEANLRTCTGAIGRVLFAAAALALAARLAPSHGDSELGRRTPEPALPPDFVR